MKSVNFICSFCNRDIVDERPERRRLGSSNEYGYFHKRCLLRMSGVEISDEEVPPAKNCCTIGEPFFYEYFLAGLNVVLFLIAMCCYFLI